MTTFNNIDPQSGSQAIFDIIYQFNDKSLFYIRNEKHNVTQVSDDFCQMVNIPSHSPIFLNDFPKLKKLEALEKIVLSKKRNKSVFFAYKIKTDLYYLFYVSIKLIKFNNNDYTITNFSKFSEFFSYEPILNSINILDDFSVDDGFPIDNYYNINPLSLTLNNVAKKEEKTSWHIIWFYLTGKSIRWIADFSHLNKKQVENSLGKFYTNSGVLNQKNLRVVARKYGWCNYVDKNTIDLINFGLGKDEKILI